MSELGRGQHNYLFSTFEMFGDRIQNIGRSCIIRPRADTLTGFVCGCFVCLLLAPFNTPYYHPRTLLTKHYRLTTHTVVFSLNQRWWPKPSNSTMILTPNHWDTNVKSTSNILPPKWSFYVRIARTIWDTKNMFHPGSTHKIKLSSCEV
jgi:hypothetical protein